MVLSDEVKSVEDETTLEEMDSNGILPYYYDITNKPGGRKGYMGIRRTPKSDPHFKDRSLKDYHIFSPYLNAASFVDGDCTFGKVREIFENFESNLDKEGFA
jgi:hypothetical protein